MRYIAFNRSEDAAPVPVDPLKDHPGYALRRASAAAMQRLATRLSSLNLRPSEATVLLVIGANVDITQSEIGRMLDIAGANMAPLMRRLQNRELIERRAVDGRSQALRLSGPGRALSSKVRKIFDSHEEELLQKIPPARRGVFLSVLHALISGSWANH